MDQAASHERAKVVQTVFLCTVVVALALAVSCSTSEPPEALKYEIEGVFVEAPETAADLPMYRGGPARTGVYRTKGVLETPEVKWVFQAQRAILSSAVVTEGKVLFGSDDGNFYALDAETGKIVWTFETEGQIRTSPLVDGGVVYFGSDDGSMSAVNIEDGEVVWRHQVRGMARSSPIMAGGTIFFGTDSGYLQAHDARTGLQSWRTSLSPSHSMGVRSSPAAMGDNIFVATLRFQPSVSILFALERSSGEVVWRYPMEGLTEFAVAAGGGAVYATTFRWTRPGDSLQFPDGRLYAVEQISGELRWVFHEEDAGAVTSPAVTGRLVLFGLYDGRLPALDILTGEVEWLFESDAPIVSAPSVADGLVYFGNADGKVTAVDLVTGQMRWEFQTDVDSENCEPICFGIESAPVLSNGVLYIGNNAGFFYALESPQ